MNERERTLWPRPAVRLILVGLVLTGGLIWAVTQHVRAVASGTEIVLRAHGFDPRSLLSGHFTQVTYDITRSGDLPRLKLQPAHGAAEVWVTIARGQEDWSITAISLVRPAEPTAGSLLVKANAREDYRSDSPTTGYTLQYGIERIYAQQSEAEALTKSLRGPQTEGEEPSLQVVASLGKDGRLRLKGLIVKGVRTDFSWW